jgi:hypothetical protein
VIVSGDAVISLRPGAPTWMRKLADVFAADPLGASASPPEAAAPAAVERAPVRRELVALYELANALAHRTADFFDLPEDVRGGIESLHEMIGDLTYGPDSGPNAQPVKSKPASPATTSERVTWLTIHHVCKPGVSVRWLVQRRDGGPLDGTRDTFETDAELSEFLMHFITTREGRVCVERLSHPVFDRLDEERERWRNLRNPHAESAPATCDEIDPNDPIGGIDF